MPSTVWKYLGFTIVITPQTKQMMGKISLKLNVTLMLCSRRSKTHYNSLLLSSLNTKYYH